MLVPLACLLLSGFSCADELLRFSDVFPIPGDNIEPFTLSHSHGKELLQVGKRVLLSDADVAAIAPVTGLDAEERRAVTIKFTEEGAEKFAKVTRQLTGGRLAVIINGKIVSAPTVREPILNGAAEISGLDEATARQLYDAFQVKSGEPPWPKDKPFWQNLRPVVVEKPETVPYTDEEYQEIKKWREGIGFHYLDSIPSKEELAKNLKEGMDYEEVLKLYGKPSFQDGGSRDVSAFAIWSVAPEKREQNLELAEVPVGFHVQFSEGRVIGWSQKLEAQSRMEKIIGLEPPTLKVIAPVFDVTKGNVSWISYVEAFKIADPLQPLNNRDLNSLLTCVIPMPQLLPDEKPGSARIDANCDFMKTLAHNFPEVAALVEQADDGKVDAHKLLGAVNPYIIGEKPLPPKAATPQE